MARYKINIEYEGTNLVGWQRQKNGISVQEILENALFKLTGEKKIIQGAGRTDAGVHALNQVAHFDLDKKIKTDAIRDGLNFHIKNLYKKNRISIFNCFYYIFSTLFSFRSIKTNFCLKRSCSLFKNKIIYIMIIYMSIYCPNIYSQSI